MSNHGHLSEDALADQVEIAVRFLLAAGVGTEDADLPGRGRAFNLGSSARSVADDHSADGEIADQRRCWPACCHLAHPGRVAGMFERHVRMAGVAPDDGANSSFATALRLRCLVDAASRGVAAAPEGGAEPAGSGAGSSNKGEAKDRCDHTLDLSG